MVRSALLLVALLPACRTLPEGAETWSLDGRPLSPPELSAELGAQRQADLIAARERYEADPQDLDAIVWLGRRTAYLGQYRAAVAIYTDGLKVHPEAPELFRHRGHRYITLRRFDAAVADLSRAVELMADRPDEIEPDGIPNAQNRPLGSLQFNVWYHLGLAYYLRDDLEQARNCYRACLKVCRNDDSVCATSHWLYMTLRRMGRDGEAADVLLPIDASMDIVENHAYHRLLLMYRGELSPDQLLGGDGSSGAAAAYGVGNWLLGNDDEPSGTEILRKLVRGDQWAAFGSIAAEADLFRRGQL